MVKPTTKVAAIVAWQFTAGVEYQLLERGTDVNAQEGEYGSALQAASYQGRKKVVEILLERGVDVNLQGGEYGSALRVATSRGHEKIVEILLERGADIHERTRTQLGPTWRPNKKVNRESKLSHRKVIDLT